MNSKERRELAISEIVLIVIGVIGLVAVLWIAWFKPLDRDAGVNSYATCAAAGNIIQDSYPSVCVARNGKRYSNPDEKIQKIPGANEQQMQPVPAEQHLIITEWRVQLPLTKGIVDASYTISSEGVAYVSTPALKAAVAKIEGCKTGLHGLYIERLKPGDPQSYGATWSEQGLQSSGATKVGSYYYHEKPLIEPLCATQANTDAVAKIGAIQTELRASLKAVEASQ
ncbi:MAG TPA: hypothetical protein VLH86_05855 [Patescibacteria group bacterium]|nr:hypothetical protein [Patescibacteria group bacterium]